MARAPFVRVNFQPTGQRRRVNAEDIVRTLRDEVGAGRLPRGSRLPPVRALEHELGISKNTVQAAYDELCARGVLVARERDGVFVAEAPAERPIAERLQAPAPRFVEMALDRQRLPEPDMLPLSMVFIDPELLPRERLAECIKSVLNIPGLHAQYDAQGYPPLREAIAARLKSRGMDVVASDIVVTTGSQQALDAVCRALGRRKIATENPVYAQAKALFSSLNAELTGLRLDPFGPVPFDEWRAVLAATRPELLYCVTSFHNPTGRSYSTHELARILELAGELGFAILEDDWGSDMLSHEEYRPTLRALGGRNVTYVNSFTKKLLPSLRLGFVAGNAETVPALVSSKRVATLGNPTLIEAALCELLERGYYDTHLASMQAELDRRYTRCLEALDALMPPEVRWTSPGGGPLLWLEVPRRVDLERLVERLAERKVRVTLLPRAFYGEPHLHGFPIGFAFLSTPRLLAGLEVLAAELTRALEEK
ncbi:MAG: PLP-dependent aminotransferase family protein [Polyangiaceae bacterium]|nr:PLP-dependent aminotransferase family protein [Polyangiaceae bacterium]